MGHNKTISIEPGIFQDVVTKKYAFRLRIKGKQVERGGFGKLPECRDVFKAYKAHRTLDQDIKENIRSGRIVAELDLHLKSYINVKTPGREGVTPFIRKYFAANGDPFCHRVTRSTLEDFLNYAEGQGKKSNTRRNYLSLIRLMFQRLIKRLEDSGQPVFDNPVDKLSRSEKPKKEDARSLILPNLEWHYFISRPELTDYAKLACVIADYTAMRRGEILNLKWTWFYNSLAMIRIPSDPKEFTTKNKHSRVVPVHPELQEIFRRLMENRWPKCDYIVHYNGKPLTTLQKPFNTTKEVVQTLLPFSHKIREFVFHDLRHRAITRWMAIPKPLGEVMLASGHRTLDAFAGYNNPSEKDLEGWYSEGEQAKIETISADEFFNGWRGPESTGLSVKDLVPGPTPQSEAV